MKLSGVTNQQCLASVVVKCGTALVLVCSPFFEDLHHARRCCGYVWNAFCKPRGQGLLPLL
jgi:hypothetical protein